MDFELPDDLTGASLNDLLKYETDAVKAFDALAKVEPADLTDDQVQQMEALADAVARLRKERDARGKAAAKRAVRAQKAREALATATQPDEPEGDQPDEEGGNEEQPQPQQPQRKGGDEQPDEDDGEDQPESVAASNLPAVRKANTVATMKKSAPPVPERPKIALLAAADVPGFSTGQRLEGIPQVAEAFLNKHKGLPSGYVKDLYVRTGVANIERPSDPDLVVPARGMSDESFMDLMDKAASETRLPGGSLVAAGGWCAPSETLYDLCVTETLDGLIDLPEMGIRRGGIRFTRGPQFADIYANAGFMLTEAQVIAGTPKPCVEIACPDFEEIRMDVSGVCVRVPLLTNVGYPELVRRWIEGTLVAQQHKESAEVISRMVAAVQGGPQTITGGAGAGFDLLTALEWSATTQKYRYRMAIGATLEVVLPLWARPILRADLALRQGTDIGSVSDAQITNHFGSRGVRVQWVYDWQPLNTATTQCFAAIPANIQALIYPAGTFVKGTADVISLDAVYDSTGLQQNWFTALFAESGFLVANRCYDPCLIQVPTCILGASGGTLDACLDLAAA